MSIVVLVTVEVLLVLGPPTFSTRKFLLTGTGMMGGLFHLRVIS